MKPLIQKLVEIVSPSGHEAPIRELIRSEIEPYVDEARVDALGSLIARKGRASEGGLRIMLAAHMDEIGVMVTHVDERGFLRFVPIGGVRPHTCIGGRVRFPNGQLGVIYMERPEDPSKLPSIEQLFIDVGAARREDVAQRVGDVAAFDRPFVDLGNRMVSKAMDDRISVAILIEVLRCLADGNLSSPHELVFVFSVQEEVGVRGAVAALGKGPAIKVRDAGMLADPRLVDWMVRTAQSAGLPFQYEVLEGGSTDARAMQLTRAGVPAGCLSIPCRYIHSPSEMVDYGDVQNAVKLLVELLKGPIQLEG
jgi:endoglucanase